MVTPFPEAKTADTAEMGAAAAATGGSLGAALLPTGKESTAPASSDAEAFRQLAEAALAAHARGEAGPQEPHLLIRILQKAGSYASFSPMILVAVIPDIRVAALVAACVAVFNFLVATALRWRGVLKVWPKTFDLVNIAIYVVAMAASFTHPDFTRLWMPVWTSGLTGLYFLASLLVRRPFTVELAKESAPEWMWGNAAFYAMNFWISLAHPFK
ncbi:hypothetical protein MNEG_10261 [Monoraphidium neglectum]|uniref:Uncharacterized protein n=1 Tax=Monoraphidium neglectum TaxID=145388 RepID=A0A0D2M234_9CHLO|nr:hypothetical protein MNEG_10261 [Monoraphidium neglectum]KIY97699.1 hypothetical protein MNEG_10261 [Monoraphidium neglectum]|eukprot:XP_013896719.1 hypothetical protein MNEG_10261 [Monoraphidium neglectum]